MFAFPTYNVIGFMDVSTWELIGKSVAALTGISSVLLILYKALHSKILTPFKKILYSIESSAAQLRPNGGTSIHDKIDKIAKATELNASRVITLLDTSSTCVYECNPDGSWYYANDTLCKLFNVPKEDMMVNGWLKGLGADERERVYHIWSTAVKLRLPYECSYKLTSGDIISTVAEPMLSSDGELFGYRGTLVILPDPLNHQNL